MNLKSMVRGVAPPLLLSAARLVRESFTRPEWECAPNGWNGEIMGPGWEHESVLQAQAARWPGFARSLAGRGPFTESAETVGPDPYNVSLHNTLMVFGYVLARAARTRSRLRMLDWGGGIGHYYALGRAMLPEVEIEYHCRDTAQLVRHGRTLHPEAHFYDDDSCLAERYDLVLASSSVQYSRDWAGLLSGLARATARFMLVTRLPVVLRADSYVAVQRPRGAGYRTEYLGWVLNRHALVREAEACGLALEREFLIDERPRIRRAPEPCVYRGFLFTPPGTEAQA